MSESQIGFLVVPAHDNSPRFEPFAWVATFAPAIGHAIENGGKRYRIRDIVHGNPSRLEVGLIGGVDDSV